MNTPKQPPCQPSQTPSQKRITTLLWAAFVVWGITLFILSSIPGNRMEPLPFPQADKVVHTIIFATGSALLAFAFFRTFGHSALKTSALVFVAMVLIGFGDEFHQTFTPGRSGDDPGDLTADAIGALIGIVAARFFNGRRSSNPNLPPPRADRAA